MDNIEIDFQAKSDLENNISLLEVQWRSLIEEGNFEDAAQVLLEKQDLEGELLIGAAAREQNPDYDVCTTRTSDGEIVILFFPLGTFDEAEEIVDEEPF